jgi:hypothetical protein
MIKNVFARYLAMLLIGGALIGGAAVALAGMAGAATPTQATGPGCNYAPTVKAHPAPTQQPGWHHHHGAWHIEGLGK